MVNPDLNDVVLKEPRENRGLMPYLVIVGGILTQLILGTLFSFGNIVPYFATYLTYDYYKDTYSEDNCELYKNKYSDYVSQCNWIYAAAVIFEAAASIVGGAIENRMGPASSCLLGSFILSLGVGLTYFTLDNIYLTILTYGLMFGIGAGIAYPGGIVCGMKWWPHRRGMVTGLIAAGFGSGAFVFDYIQTIFVNPHNYKESDDCGFLQYKDVIDRIPKLFLLLASIYIVMQLTGVLLLRNPPDEEDDLNCDTNSLTDGTGKTGSDTGSYVGHDFRSLKNEDIGKDYFYKPMQALRMWKFWQLFLNAMTNVTVFLFVSAEWKIYANHLGVESDSYLAIIGSASSLCNGLFRIAWGLFYDWNGSFAISMGTMCIIMTIFTATLSLCSASPNIMLFVWICVLFVCVGGNYTFFPTVITETFGVKYNGVIIGMLLLAEIPSSLIFTFLCDNIQEIFGGWDNLIIAVSCFSGASCLLSVTFSPKINHDNYQEWHKQNEIEALHEIEEKEKQQKLKAKQQQSILKDDINKTHKNRKSKNKSKDFDNRSIQSIERARKHNKKLKKQERLNRHKNRSNYDQPGMVTVDNTEGDIENPLITDAKDLQYDYNNNNNNNGMENTGLDNDFLDEIRLIDPAEQVQNSWNAYLSVIGGILVQLVLGTLFSFGNLVPYFATYLTYYQHKSTYDPNNCDGYKDDYTNNVSYCNWIFAVAIIAEAGASVIGGKFELLMGAARSCMFGSFILSLGVGLTYFAIKNLYFVIFTYGLMFGIGAGIAYPGSIVCGMKWWPHRRGMVTGLIAAGFGSGAFFFDYVQTIFVNPDNHEENKNCGFLESKEVIDKIPGVFLLLAGIYLIMQITGVLMLKQPPCDDFDEKEDNNNNNNKDGEIHHSRHNSLDDDNRSYIGHDYRSLASEELGMDRIDIPPNEALRMWKFWQLFLNSMTNVTVFLFVSAEWKIFAGDYLNIKSDQFLSIVGSVSSLCNGLCRILWGLFYDWNGSFAVSMGTMCAIMTAFTATLTFCKQDDQDLTETLLFVWVCLLFACLGGNYTFFPTVVTETFGVKYNGVLIGFLLLSEIPSSLIFTFLYQNLKAIFGGWVQLCICMGGFGLASTILSVTYSPEIKHKDKTKEQESNKKRKSAVGNKESDTVNNDSIAYKYSKLTEEHESSNVPSGYIIDPNTGYRRSMASVGSAAGTHSIHSIPSISGAAFVGQSQSGNYLDIIEDRNKTIQQFNEQNGLVPPSSGLEYGQSAPQSSASAGPAQSALSYSRATSDPLNKALDHSLGRFSTGSEPRKPA